MVLTINFKGRDLDVSFDREPGEEAVGLHEDVRVYKVEYLGRDITGFLSADFIREIEEETYFIRN